MGFFSKVVLLVLLLDSIVSVTIISEAMTDPYPNQKYANFNETQINYIRYIIQRAAERQFSQYKNQFDAMKEYIYIDLDLAYPGFWNVIVYNKDDWRNKFYLTGMYDESTRNKRFYQVVDAGTTLKYSVIILETNNTFSPDVVDDKGKSRYQQKIYKEKLNQCQIWSSTFVPMDKVYDIQQFITKTYRQNDNLIDLAFTVQRYLKNKYSEHWQVFTQLREVKDLGIFINSVDFRWVRYYYYDGEFPKDITVFVFKNYING